MSAFRRPPLIKRFFSLWLAAVAALILLLGWAFTVLDPSDRPEPTASSAPAASGQQGERPTVATPVPPFDPDKAEYLVTAFSLQGMQHVTDAEPAFTLLPPGNTVVAQVLKRGPSPELPMEGVNVRYALDNPYADGPNSGAASGVLAPSEEVPFFVSEPIVVLPYTADSRFEPYPTATVEALDDKGAVLAQTGLVVPVSTEIGCRNCHTGDWKVDGKAGISAATAGNILAVHDRRNNTRLARQAESGQTVVCRSCHSGQGDEPVLSAALHGFHATMKLEGAEACGMCHPSSEKGATGFYRGYHAMWGLDCTRCHGPMADHAISLLRFEAARGNKAAAARLAQIRPSLVAEAGEIAPRQPWVNLPQCSGCHDFKSKPDPSTATAFNKWTEKEDELFSRALDNTGVLRCPSCHGAPHALYPATNPTGDDRDNLQPLQYQKAAMPLGKDGNCAACHTEPMDVFVHHDRVEQ